MSLHWLRACMALGRLTAMDANTITFDAVPRGVTYIPIPVIPVDPIGKTSATAAATPIQSSAG